MAPTRNDQIIMLVGELKRGQENLHEHLRECTEETRKWRETTTARVDSLAQWQDRARFVLYTIGPILLLFIGAVIRKYAS